ncbi:MAG: hypothetical protein MUO55_05855 [Candidatus Atribacteria bacterium]|nr:hypothetical protein [Candidatus Atribacteria bacterium]
MKKLLFVLLIVALASYLFVGCLPVTPSEGEGEGEGEGESEVVVAIEGAVVIDGKTYVSGEDHMVTVTFPAPVAGWVEGFVEMCYGDYSTKDSGFILFPDADRKVWTGSAEFYYGGQDDCCATYISIDAGECEDVVCIYFPVIVDSCPPYAEISVVADDCECEGCSVTFSSTEIDPLCEEAELCCGDDCSGLASWAINLYDSYPFNTCCDPSVCEEPIATDSGLCPIDFTTACLPAGEYWAVINLVDKVGLEQNYYAHFVLAGGLTAGGDDCEITLLEEGFEIEAPDCIEWETADTIGACESDCLLVTNGYLY